MKPEIIVVDDNRNDLHLFVEILTEHGYDVRPALNGHHALISIQAKPPDLIVLDINMPQVSGYEVCEQLKADAATRDIPVIFLSAADSVTDKVKAFQMGGVDYITKPYKTEEVLARISLHLDLLFLRKRLETQNIQLQEEIAERKQIADALRVAHDELREKNAQLHELNAGKDKFFSIISHDLRSPFNALLGYTKLLSEHIEIYAPDEIKKRVDKIHDAAEQLYVLLENLLTWSRIQRGIMKYAPEKLDLKMIAENILALFTPNAEQKHLTLCSMITEQVWVYGDFAMISAVLRNLISNAIKFTPSDGCISVSATAAHIHGNRAVEIAVADTGIGIPPERFPTIFQIGDQQITIGTMGEKGTGLGLVLCKELVEKNGGILELESELGKGAIFRFTLPAEPPSNIPPI